MADFRCSGCNALIVGAPETVMYGTCVCGAAAIRLKPSELPVPGDLIEAINTVSRERGIQVRFGDRKLTVRDPSEPPPLDQYEYELGPEESWWQAAHECGLVELKGIVMQPKVEADEGADLPTAARFMGRSGSAAIAALRSAGASAQQATQSAGALSQSLQKGRDLGDWQRQYGAPIQGVIGGDGWCCESCGFMTQSQEKACGHSEQADHYVYHYVGSNRDGGCIWPSGASGCYINPPGTKAKWQ